MNKFSLFLENRININDIISFVALTLDNEEEETNLVVFADYLEEKTNDSDLIAIGEILRKMILGNTFQKEKLFEYSNSLRKAIYDGFVNSNSFDLNFRPLINVDNRQIEWRTKDYNCIFSGNNIRKMGIIFTKIIPIRDQFYVDLKDFLIQNPELELPIIKFLVLIVLSREENSWIHNHENNRMARIWIYKTISAINIFFQEFPFHNSFKEIQDCINKAKQFGANKESLFSVAQLITQFVNDILNRVAVDDTQYTQLQRLVRLGSELRRNN